MFPRSSAPKARPVHSPGSPPQPPMRRYYDHNPQTQAGGTRNMYPDEFDGNLGPYPRSLPAYEWKPTPPIPAVPPPPPPHTSANRRKRHRDEYDLNVVKRQRFDSSSHTVRGSPLNDNSPPLRHPQQAVAGPSISPSTPNLSSRNPHSHQHPHLTPEGSKNLQFYARDKLSDQMVELFEACQQQSADLIWKETCRARLQQDMQRIYAVARLYLTGSSMNGLGCRSSDADLCLVISGNKRPDPIHVLSDLQQLFKSLSYVERTQLIRAKVPILKFREKSSHLEFDLNINNTVGIRNTFLLRSYAYADVRVRPMILVVKKWARHNQINDASKGTLSSYALVLMVLHYLQTLRDPVLPSLQRDFPNCFSPMLDIDMVPEAPKHIPSYNTRNHSSLGELLLGFLKYYARDFRWDKQVISVREAKAFTKNNSPDWRNKYICVEEPFERRNVARAVHEQVKFDAIRAQFAESWRILQTRKDLNSILPVRVIINKESSRR